MPKPLSDVTTRQKQRRIGAKIKQYEINTPQVKRTKVNDVTTDNLIPFIKPNVALIDEVESDTDSNFVNELQTNISLQHTTNDPFASLLDTNLIHEQTNSTNIGYVDSIDKIKNFTEELRVWAVEFNITTLALNGLLIILKTLPELKSLPNDSRTIMHTPRNTSQAITNLAGGQFAYFGFEKSLIHSLDFHYVTIPNNIKVNINVDGLPITKSSNSQFWPLLGAIVDDNLRTKPFVVGIYHGFCKPSCANEFLNSFVTEAKIILKEGLVYKNQNIKVTINAIICDAPAKAFVSGIKSHNAYFGCSKCIQEGEYIDHRMTFPEMDSILRNNESFRNKDCPEHHRITSVLENLPIDMVRQLTLDGMHLVHIGCVKRLIQFWVAGKKDVRLTNSSIEIVSTHLAALKSCLTEEFGRKPRGLEEVDRWKAIEFRQFLLYTGPVVMKSVLRQDYYDHFLTLSVAIRILSDKSLHLQLNGYANSILRWFVENYAILYGEQHLGYNLHNLIHLAKEVQTFGPLDGFSAFKFENFMQDIKKKIRKGRNPLQQLCNRLHETTSLSHQMVERIFPILHYNKASTILKKVTLQNYTISNQKFKNCFSLKDGSIIEVEELFSVNDTIMLKTRSYLRHTSYFDLPSESYKYGIKLVNEDDLDSELREISIDNIHKKCLKLFLKPSSSQYIIVPLIHTNAHLAKN